LFCFVLIHRSQLLKLWIILYERSWEYSLSSVTLKFFHEKFGVIIYVYVHICCWWLYMFVCIYVVGGYICLCAYMLLVSIYVYVHICCWWISLTCYWWWIVVVSMYWTMVVWNCRIRMKYVLLLSSPKFTHSCCWILSPCLVANTFVFNYAVCLCGVIIVTPRFPNVKIS